MESQAVAPLSVLAMTIRQLDGNCQKRVLTDIGHHVWSWLPKMTEAISTHLEKQPTTIPPRQGSPFHGLNDISPHLPSTEEVEYMAIQARWSCQARDIDFGLLNSSLLGECLRCFGTKTRGVVAAPPLSP